MGFVQLRRLLEALRCVLSADECGQVAGKEGIHPLSTSRSARRRLDDAGSRPGANPRLPREEVVVLDVGDVPGDRLQLRLPLVAGYWKIGNVRVDYSPDLPIAVVEVKPSEARDRQGQNVLPLLQADDNWYYVTEKGDEATISFPSRRRRRASLAPSSSGPAGTTQFTDYDGRYNRRGFQ